MTQRFHCGRFVLNAERPLIMGIVNLTDDSFSGDGHAGNAAAAIEHGLQQAAAGAHILDIGAESTRPGADPVSAQQEIDRLLPVVEGLRYCGLPLSIDTFKPEVMRVALNAGADMINDINALRAPGAVEIVAAGNAGVCLMHIQGEPGTMQREPHYEDVVAEVAGFLAERVATLEVAGVPLNRICVDPGFGFGKTLEHNLALLRRLEEMVVPGLPLLVGMSRKSMLGLLTGRPAPERVHAGIAAHLMAVERGARIVRVHDVAATRDALAILQAVEESDGTQVFGTDGVRGRVGQSPITPDFVMRLGYAAGTALIARDGLPVGEHPAVLIGKDTRISGYMLEAALEAGFSAAGVDVMLCGPMPTPAVAYLTRALRLQAGVVISASHNPFDDNGIKFFSAQGTKLPDAVELDIEARLDQPMTCMESAKLGKARRVDDAAGRYIEFCKSTFPNDLDLRGMKIVVDSAHGAAYHVAPSVFHELGAEIVGLGDTPNGLNINAGVGATAPEALRRKVIESRADCGIALDGDGDRLVMVDAAGDLYDGDRLLYIIARHRSRTMPVPGVAGTLMSNLGFEHALGRLGIACGRAKVGDRYVLEMMQEKGWLMGGENSGHIICLDRHTTGDGIIAALQVLAALRAAGETLAEACVDLSLYPQKLINVRMPAGFDWKSDAGIAAATKTAEARLDGAGRVLLRPSGTEPLLRVMVEAQDGTLVAEQAEAIAGAVRRAIGE